MKAIGRVIAALIVIVVAVAIGGVLFAPGLVGTLVRFTTGQPAVDEQALLDGTEITGDAYPGDPATESALVEAETQRLVVVRTAASAGASAALDTTQPFRVETEGRATLLLPARTEPYGLAEIADLAPATLSTGGPDGAFVLAEHLAVMDGAALVITAGERLVLASDGTGFSSLVAYGDLRVDGAEEARVTISSWDPTTGGTDDTTADGRGYLRVIGGTLNVASADFRSLGFWSGETGGLSYDGARPVEQELSTASPGEDGAPTVDLSVPAPAVARLQISATTVSGNAFGLTVAGVEAPSITGSSFLENLADGLVLDGDVSGAVIDTVESARNARDGVVLERTTSATTLTALTITGNGRNGLVLDGAPPAEGPNSTGADTTASGDFTVLDSVFADNARAGIDVVGGTAVRISGAKVTGGDMGIVLDAGPRDVEIAGSLVSGQARHGISIRDDAADVLVTGNTISAVEIGIYVRNAQADVTGNDVSDAALHGIVLTGQLHGSQVTDNQLAGTGPSAIDDESALDARVEGNLVDGWASSRSLDQILTTLMQPLTVVWIAVVTLVMVAFVTRLGAGRKRGDPLRDPTPLQSLGRGAVDRTEAARFTP